MTPEISVLVASYNVEPYLAQCLDSIVGQTLREIEVIVVDDASTDGSAHLARSYLEQDPRVRLIEHEENRGLGAVRNTGLDAASGRYVAVVDGDDWLARNDALEAVHARCESEGVPVGVFPALDYFEAHDRFAANAYTSLQVSGRFRMGPSLLTRVAATTWTKMYARALLVDSGVRFPEGIHHEDEVFHFCFFAATEPWVVTLDEPIYVYRQRAESIMDRHRHTRRDVPAVFARIWDFLVREELTERYADVLCRMIASQFRERLYRLHREAQEPFYDEMREVVCRISATGRVASLPEPLDDVVECDYAGFLQRRHEELVELRRDPWFRFGQLSGGARMKRLIRLAAERLGLGPVVKRLRSGG